MNFCMACGAPVELSGEKFCTRCKAHGDTRYRFGKRLKSARKAAGLTQAQLGNILYLTQRSISDYEKGRREPQLSTLERLAQTLKVSVDWLIGLE